MSRDAINARALDEPVGIRRMLSLLKNSNNVYSRPFIIDS